MTGSKNGAAAGDAPLHDRRGARGARGAHARADGHGHARRSTAATRGQGSTMKLIGNTLISFMLEGLCEGLVVGCKRGSPSRTCSRCSWPPASPRRTSPFKGGAIARRDFDTHFSIDLLVKDQTPDARGGGGPASPMPGLAAIREVCQAARAPGPRRRGHRGGGEGARAAAGPVKPTLPRQPRVAWPAPMQWNCRRCALWPSVVAALLVAAPVVGRSGRGPRRAARGSAARRRASARGAGGREASLRELAQAAQGIRGEHRRGPSRAGRGQGHRAGSRPADGPGRDSLRRLEAVVAGSSSRGAARREHPGAGPRPAPARPARGERRLRKPGRGVRAPAARWPAAAHRQQVDERREPGAAGRAEDPPSGGGSRSRWRASCGAACARWRSTSTPSAPWPSACWRCPTPSTPPLPRSTPTATARASSRAVLARAALRPGSLSPRRSFRRGHRSDQLGARLRDLEDRCAGSRTRSKAGSPAASSRSRTPATRCGSTCAKRRARPAAPARRRDARRAEAVTPR